jgi:hypothetical protein
MSEHIPWWKQSKKSDAQLKLDRAALAQKKTADDQWSRAYKAALGGKIDHAAMGYAIDACNVADKKVVQMGLWRNK